MRRQELISLLEKEKSIALEEEEEGDCMLVFAILSLIAYVNEYSDNHLEGAIFRYSEGAINSPSK